MERIPSLALLVGLCCLQTGRGANLLFDPDGLNPEDVNGFSPKEHRLTAGGYPGPFMRFLLSVNATQDGPHGCVATTVTNALQPRVKYNQSDAIDVGGCDKGPLRFDLTFPAHKGDNMTIDLTFYSSVIEDASPPTCQISWDGHYLTPPPPPMSPGASSQPGSEMPPMPSLLPGCFTMESREGWHMTYYWFYLLEWGF